MEKEWRHAAWEDQPDQPNQPEPRGPQGQPRPRAMWPIDKGGRHEAQGAGWQTEYSVQKNVVRIRARRNLGAWAAGERLLRVAGRFAVILLAVCAAAALWPGLARPWCCWLLPVSSRISRAAGDLPLWPLQFPLPCWAGAGASQGVLSLCLGLGCRPRAWPALFARFWNYWVHHPFLPRHTPGVPASCVFGVLFFFLFFTHDFADCQLG